jgi:hypothetical protein
MFGIGSLKQSVKHSQSWKIGDLDNPELRKILKIAEDLNENIK